MPLPRSLFTGARSIARHHPPAHLLRPLASSTTRFNSTSSFVDVQHSELLARAGDKPQVDVDKDGQAKKDVKRRAEELSRQEDTSRWTGKLTPTTSHLFKLVLPLPRSLAALSQGQSEATAENSSTSRQAPEPTARQPELNVVETAYLLHPSQPLSHVSRLILGSLPSSERSAEVEFRAVSGRDHDAYPSATSPSSSTPDASSASADTSTGSGSGSSGEVEALETVAEEGGPILNDRNPNGAELQEVRWSTSTDLGDFIKQSTLAQEFKIVVRPEESSTASTSTSVSGTGSAGSTTMPSLSPLTLKVKIPTFASRTVYLRRRLLKLTTEIAKMTEQKKMLDKEAHRAARRYSVMGLGGLVAYWGVVFKLTFFSPLGWDVMEPVTYLSGLTTVIGGYLFFLYHQREVSYSSVLDLSVSAKQQELYQKQQLDVERWTELVAEAKALRTEMTKIAADYDYDWKGQLEGLEDVEVEVKQKDGSDKTSPADEKGDKKKETVTSVYVRTDDGKKVDIDDTIDEAADMERQARKKESTRRHGKGGNTEEMDASQAAGERKAQKVIGQEPISAGEQKRGLHTDRAQRDARVPFPVVGRVGLGRSFSTSSISQAASVQVSEQMYKLITHKVAAYQEALKAQSSGDEQEVSEQIQLARTIKESEPLVEAWKGYNDAIEAWQEAETLLRDNDPDMKALAEDEIASLRERLTELCETQLPSLLLPSSQSAQLSAILEIKAGAGGDEASLFVEEVMRMYMRYAAERNWRTSILSKTVGNVGGNGLKDVTLEVKGEGAFGDFRFERGVHRVQRVPATESAGRVHTSTIAVVVLPLSENSNETSDDLVDEKDVKTEVMRARGAGGQHVNKTESAVRLTHIPTGITVSMQDSRSQHQNKAWAWQILRARLLDQKMAQAVQDRRDTRRLQVKGMDRSDKVRTYNFPQDRVTDHRIGLTTTGLEGILEGEGLDYIISKLKDYNQGLRLESLLETGEDLDE